MTNPITHEMMQIVRGAAEPWHPGDSVKVGIGRAARRLGLGYRRAQSLWYGTAPAIRADEADKLRAARLVLAGERIHRLQIEIETLRAFKNESLDSIRGMANIPTFGCC